MKKINLKELRIEAKITQKQMAEKLGVTQSQISRYEDKPEEVPWGICSKWEEICGDYQNEIGLELDDPRDEINSRVKLVENYAESAKPIKPIELKEDEWNKKIDGFVNNIKGIVRKPRIGVLGRFDQGKSRLCNTILGKDCLPTKYQPQTSINCLIRHISDKPDWQVEDVWIMGHGFNFDMSSNRDDCERLKITAGGYEELIHSGTHTGKDKRDDAYAAVVYVDAPFLTGCDLVDMPGYGHSDNDNERIEMTQHTLDGVIYLSTAQGFLENTDLAYLSGILKKMPMIDDRPLRNVWIVATRADIIPENSELDALIRDAAKRAYRYLDNHIKDPLNVNEDDSTKKWTISLKEFTGRFFPYAAEHPKIRNRFDSDLSDFIAVVHPDDVLQRATSYIETIKNKSENDCTAWITRLHNIIKEKEMAQAYVEKLESLEPERLKNLAKNEAIVISEIKKQKYKTSEQTEQIFSQNVSIELIEGMIEGRYEKKKEAQTQSASYLMDKIQKQVSIKIQNSSIEFAKTVDTYLENYIAGTGILAPSMSLELDFNAKAAFMGALAGVGTFGALAAWASIAAAGSNLGAYILLPAIVSMLSSIGIGVGGTAAAISFIATIGGPVTLGIGLAISVGLMVANFFGDSWQRSLAKKINKLLIKEKALDQILSSVTKYWDNTEKKFLVVAMETEKTYQKHLSSLRELAFSTDPAVLERQIKYVKEIRSFFGAIPWRSLL